MESLGGASAYLPVIVGARRLRDGASHALVSTDESQQRRQRLDAQVRLRVSPEHSDQPRHHVSGLGFTGLAALTRQRVQRDVPHEVGLVGERRGEDLHGRVVGEVVERPQATATDVRIGMVKGRSLKISDAIRIFAQLIKVSRRGAEESVNAGERLRAPVVR